MSAKHSVYNEKQMN